MKETQDQRSRIMRAVKGVDTAPEMAVRRMAHSMGFRFRLHRKDLPGKPDLVFPKLRKVVFVHGCFWHGQTARVAPELQKPTPNIGARKSVEILSGMRSI